MLRKKGKPLLAKKRVVGSTKTASSKPTSSNTKSSSAKSETVKGFKMAKRLNEESQRKRDIPFRFFIKQGESAKIVLLDKEPFFLFEHQYETRPGKWDGLVRCRKEVGICPACDKLGKEGSYIMMMTCLDTTKFKDRKGVTHKNTKKLIAIKQSMIVKYERLFKDKKQNLRGVVLEVFRDGPKAPNTGDEFRFVKRLTEDELTALNKDNTPISYEKAMPIPSEEDLRLSMNMGKPAGSEDFEDGDLDDVSWDGDDE
jgi:hypothetical protein